MALDQKDQKILDNVEYFKDRYFAFDEPVPFYGLFLYPVPVTHYNEFMSCCTCLKLNKLDDPAGFKLTHLDYLLYKMKDEKEGQIWSYKFSTIMNLCLHVDNGWICPKCKKFMNYKEVADKMNDENIRDKEEILKCECGEKFIPTMYYKKEENSDRNILIINGIELNYDKYNELRKYILYQNLPSYKDYSDYAKSFRDEQEAAAKLRSEQSGKADLERQIVGLCAQLHYTLDQAKNLSMRKFTLLLSMIDDICNYNTLKIGLSSGFRSLPKGQTLPHWLYRKDDASDGTVDVDSLISKT